MPQSGQFIPYTRIFFLPPTDKGIGAPTNGSEEKPDENNAKTEEV